MNTPKLPPLPEWFASASESLQNDVKNYAIAAIQAQGVQDGWRAEAKKLAPILASMGEGGYDLETLYVADPVDGDCFVKRAADLLLLLASAPAAPQASAMRPDTLYLLRRLLSNQHTLTGSEFREELTKIVAEASEVQQEPKFWAPPERAGAYHAHDAETVYRTPKAGWYPLYTHPGQQAKPQPLSDCWCESCDIAQGHILGRTRMSICPQCGDKRCPRAKHHDSSCQQPADHLPDAGKMIADKPQPLGDPLHDDIQSVLFEVEQAIQNGCCPWQIEAAFEAYEAARRLQQHPHGIKE